MHESPLISAEDVHEPRTQSAVDTNPEIIETRGDRMARLAAELLQIGVSRQQTVKLLGFDLDRVEQQLIWLPYRKAQKKASLIVAAIEQNYDAPARWEADGQ